MTDYDELAAYGGPDIEQKISDFLKKLTKRKFAQIGVTDAAFIETINEFLSDSPNTFTDWDYRLGQPDLVPIDDNTLLVLTHLVEIDENDQQIPSPILVEIVVRRDSPLELYSVRF